MEGEVELGLEAGDVVRRLARQADLDRQVEQDRQVGPQAVGREPLQGARSSSARQPGAIALVGERRVGEPGADDGLAGGRAPGRITSATSWRARGVEQERVGQRVAAADVSPVRGRGGSPGSARRATCRPARG